MVFAYVGTFTRHGKSRGIYVFQLDVATGALNPVQTVNLENPTYLVASSERRLYVAIHSRRFLGRSGGGLVAFAWDETTGRLTRLGHRGVYSPHPAYVSLDRKGRFVFVASTLGGGISVFPIDKSGRLGSESDRRIHDGESQVPHGSPAETEGDWPPAFRPGAPMAHCIVVDPSNSLVFVTDRGLDRVFLHRFDDTTGKLKPGPHPWELLPPGSGPRHIVFHPHRAMFYVINELASSITVFEYSVEDISFRCVETVPLLPVGYRGRSIAADIHAHPSGRFLFASNRGHDSIASLAIDEGSGRLELVELQSTRGLCPRGFAVTPNAQLLLVANQNSDSIVTLQLDDRTGRLTYIGRSASVPSPTCIAFAASGPAVGIHQ